MVATKGDETMTRNRTKQVPGYRVQPMLPISISWFGAVCEDAVFTTYDGRVDGHPCVEAVMRLGIDQKRHTLVLSYEQALEADIVERTER
jgi:hypothetical protein